MRGETQSQDDLARSLDDIGRGDVEAMRTLYDATCDKMFGICMVIVRDPAAAEDVLQEIYLKVWNMASGYDRAKGAPLAWLSVIARNCAIDWRRAQARHQAGHDPEALLLIADDKEPIDDTISRQEEAARAAETVDDLDESAQSCIRNAFFRGLTYAQVAQEQDLPLGTVKSRIRRGLQRMKKMLENG